MFSSIFLQGAYFVTGTDTEIGKTTVTAQLVQQLATHGKAVYAIKPITAGLAIDQQGNHYSEDAQLINQFATVKPPLSTIAPIQLTNPCSPHIASEIDGIDLQVNDIVKNIQQTLQNYPADVVLIEGAGGWFTPINHQHTLADVAINLQLPIIVVIGVKLGCLNHTVLTLNAIWQAGLNVAMVVINQLSSDTVYFHEQTSWIDNFVANHALHYQTFKPSVIYQDYL